MTKREFEKRIKEENLLTFYDWDDKMTKGYISTWDFPFNTQAAFGVRDTLDNKYESFITNCQRGGMAVSGATFATLEEAYDDLYRMVRSQFEIAVKRGYMTPDGEILAEDDESNYWS